MLIFLSCININKYKWYEILKHIMCDIMIYIYNLNVTDIRDCTVVFKS